MSEEDVCDYDCTAEVNGVVSKDESVMGRSKTSVLVTPDDTRLLHGRKGGSTTKGSTSAEAGDKKKLKASADDFDLLVDAEEESRPPVGHVAPGPKIGGASGIQNTQDLRVSTIPPRKRRSPASSERSDSALELIRPTSTADWAEETEAHDGPSKSISDSRRRNPSVGGNKTTEEPRTKRFKPNHPTDD